MVWHRAPACMDLLHTEHGTLQRSGQPLLVLAFVACQQTPARIALVGLVDFLLSLAGADCSCRLSIHPRLQ
jgi:hypothetical protein